MFSSSGKISCLLLFICFVGCSSTDLQPPATDSDISITEDADEDIPADTNTHADLDDILNENETIADGDQINSDDADYIVMPDDDDDFIYPDEPFSLAAFQKYFPDIVLRDAISNYTMCDYYLEEKCPEGQTWRWMKEVTSVSKDRLYCDPYLESYNLTELKTLEGLQYLKNIKDFAINAQGVCDVESIDQLEALPNLEHVYFQSLGNIRSYTVLEKVMPQLKTFKLFAKNTGGDVGDLSMLGKATKLERIAINDTLLSDISWISNMTNLWEILLNDNHIREINPLVELFDKLKTSQNEIIFLVLGDNCLDIDGAEKLNTAKKDNPKINSMPFAAHKDPEKCGFTNYPDNDLTNDSSVEFPDGE